MSWINVFGFVPRIIKQIKDFFDSDNEKIFNKNLEQRLSQQIEDLICENREKEKINKENEEKLAKLTEMMNNLIEDQKKKN